MKKGQKAFHSESLSHLQHSRCSQALRYFYKKRSDLQTKKGQQKHWPLQSQTEAPTGLLFGIFY